MTGAERMRVYRRRQRRGLVKISFEADEVALVNALLDAGLVDERATLDPYAVERAAGVALAQWIRCQKDCVTALLPAAISSL